MLTTIVFSKDRPLQLQAYLDSLMYYSEIKSEDIYVLYQETPAISYQKLIKQHQKINWVKETNFLGDLQNILAKAKDFILWGCDDVFFKSAFDINICIQALDNNQDVFAFSLRLGKNILPLPSFRNNNNYLTWNWVETHFPECLDWDYPWEVSASIYRKSEISEILQIFSRLYDLCNPNFLEGQIAIYFAQKQNIIKNKLACFELSKCLTLTVNRVQDTHPNPFDNRLETDPQGLYHYFNEGYILNYRKFENCQNQKIHVDSSYFDLIKPDIQTSSYQPLVSIICPTYNNGHYIEETIKSILDQTYDNFEFIILDDGSTDNTQEIIQKYLNDPRIKYFYQENIGQQGLMGEVRNNAINKSVGGLICFIDSDDVCLSSRLEKQVAQFQNDPELDFCCSDGFHIDAMSKLRQTDFRYEEIFNINSFNLLRILFRKNIVPAPTVMFKRSLFNCLNGFKPNLKVGEDYDLWLRAAPYFNFKFIDEKLIKYRFHEKSLSTSSANAQNIYNSTINILMETRQKYSIFDLYPEIYRCQTRHRALYSAYLDFGNTMLTANIPVPEIAVQEYQKALKHVNGIEALNNLAVALWAIGQRQESGQLFEQLKQIASNFEVIQHNVNLIKNLQFGVQNIQANFVLLNQSVEDSELLQVIEELSVKNHPETSIVAKPISLSEIKLISNQPRIVLYSDDPEIYGAAQYNQALLKGLAKTNQYQLICAQSEASHHLITEREQLGVQHIWISYDTSGQGFGRTLTDTQDAEGIFDQANPDLIIFSDCCPLSNLAAKQVAMQRGISFIVVAHNASPYLAERFAQYLPLLEQTYQLSKAVISVSQANINLLQQYFRLPSNKSKVVYNGRPEEFFSLLNQINREKIRKELNIPSNAVVCFTAARLDSGKGYQYQLEAIKQLKQLQIWDNLYFVWVGTGQLETSLKETIAKLNVENQVKLLGERSDVANLLDASDIFILPSEFEAMPFSVIEAMAKCVPVIATNVGGIPEVLGETGKLLANPLSDSNACIKEMVETIQLWATDSTLRNTLGTACKQRAEMLFTDQRMLSQTINIIKSAFSNQSIIVEVEDNDDPCKNVAQKWLKISEENLESAFSGELGNKRRELLASGIKQQLRSDEEKQFVSELNQYITKGWKQDEIAQHFLAASLYCYPHQLPSKWFENAEVPEFLVDYFVNFMFETPSFFKELGEADQYYQYVKEWVDFLHLCITTETDSPIWQQMAWVFTQRANFIPLYFNSHNLKEIYIKRAEIIEIALKQQGFQLDYVFPPRVQNRKKIRVGFLSNHFTPQTETFSTLPAFEHLDRGFEVILYANITNGHPLEKYCESRVDRLVQLPEDLNEGIQIIRQDDLDFLLIGTNTTAVTNQITILALHKLARVQGTLFSSPVTTGFRNINFYISGELSEPSNVEEHYSEQIIKLKNTGYCFNYDINPFDVTVNLSRQILNIPENAIVFSSGANVYKIVPELVESWAKILSNIPNSILLLYPFAPSWSNSYPKEPFIKHLQLILEKYNVKAEQLIIVESLPTRADVKECLKLVDIYLDSYPYTGSNSNVDPLEVGLPIIVMEGNSMRTRQGAAILRSIGLDDLVVQDEESYINLAVKLGTNVDLRTKYRGQILEKMANNPPFLDSKAYSAQIGEVLKQLFEKHIQ